MFRCISYYLGAFGTVCCVTTVSSKRAKQVQKFVPRSRVGIFRSERTRSTPLDSKLMFWCVLYYLDAFGPFGCLTKLNAKRAELVRKLVPRSRVLSFRIRHTRLSSLGPKLLFWCVSYYLGTFGTVWLPYKTRCKTGRCFAKVRAMQSCRNVSHTNTPDPPFWTLTSCVRCISYYLVAFGIVCCITTLSSKWVKLVQKFVPRGRVGILRNERTWSTPLDSKLMFWSVLYYLGAFGTIWLPYKTRCKTGWSGAKLRAMKSCRNFSQQTIRSIPLGPNLMFRCISYYLGPFGTVCCVTTLSSKRPNWCKSSCH
jgi:hypothetical protein